MRNRFAWFALAIFKFPEVDKLTDTSCKKFGFQNCGEGEGGGATIPVHVKIS